MMLFFKDANSRVLALQTDQDFTEEGMAALCWLFEGAQPVDPADPFLQGWFVGPRKEMITPWSTVAVEICINMSVNGIVRMEEFFPVPSDRATYDPMLRALYHGLDGNVFTLDKKPQPITYIKDLKKYNIEEGLALNSNEIAYLEQLAARLGRPLTDSELFGFSQVNSEHCRHKIFNGTFVIDGKEMPSTLFGLIKKTSREHPNLIVSAYKDNCAFIQGPQDNLYFTPSAPDKPSAFGLHSHPTVISLKAETHNFPTTVEPFNGAATGSGGEIRDRMAGGKASFPLAGTAVYMTSYPRLEGGQHTREGRKWLYQKPEDVLTKASNGASDFGNKFGQPLICGSLLCFEHIEAQRRFGYDKVIMLAGGVGYAKANDARKDVPQVGDKVVLLGGDNYRIGMGGGAVSSVATGEYGNAIELNAVQRANPEMQKRVYNAVRAMAECEHNPIVSIHDHGAGGHLNCLSELVEETGGRVDLSKLPIGDPTLSYKEIVGNESQERMGLVISEKDLPLLEATAQRERAPFYVIGDITGDKRFTFEDSRTGEKPIDLALEDMFGSAPKTVMTDVTDQPVYAPVEAAGDNASLQQYAAQVMQLESVACKDWLTNKVDRSVSGLIANQQCAGPLQLPLNDYGMTALSYAPEGFEPDGNLEGNFRGMATSLGHAPVPGLINAAAGSRLSIAEALTNLACAPLDGGLQGVSLSANWMWPCRNKGEDTRLYEAVQAASDFACALGINIPTGKDSLSMTQKYPDGTSVLAPGTVIISTVAPVKDVRKAIRPVLQDVPSVLLYVDFSGALGKAPLGGGALAQCLGKLGDECPDVYDAAYFARAFGAVQLAVQGDNVLSGHDVSAGGLLVCLLEMCFSNPGGGVCLDEEALRLMAPKNRTAALFAEVPGVVLQVPVDKLEPMLVFFAIQGVKALWLGTPCSEREIRVDDSLAFDIDALRKLWYKTSYLLDKRQSGAEKALERFEHFDKIPLQYVFPKGFDTQHFVMPAMGNRPRAAIIREKGSQCDREMAWALYLAGFDVKDVHTTDLVSGRETLADVQFIAFVGGFSNADTLGSAKGWAGAMLYNPKAKAAIDAFYARKDTLSLGVCNGCQLMAELGLITAGTPVRSPKMVSNDSHKFECNFVNLTIEDSPSILLSPLVGARLGVWVAHGEGKFTFPDTIDNYHVAARYSYDMYPANPNGSPLGVAAICSPCGRHLAIMPHPERCVYPWNWTYYPADRPQDKVSPWMALFTAAREFCATTSVAQ